MGSGTSERNLPSEAEPTLGRHMVVVRGGQPVRIHQLESGALLAHVYGHSRRDRSGSAAATARLYAASPIGFAIVRQAYIELLRAADPRFQPIMDGLREYLALATGRSESEVQEEYERHAAGPVAG